MSRIKTLSGIFEKEIQNLELPKEPKNLYEPIKYILEAGGKRIRPVMVLVAATMYDSPISKAIPAALALEVFHNFTLLHDDIMDNATVRRGRATVHKKWSDNIAILSGDAMVIHSYKLLSQCDTPRLTDILESFNLLAALVCEGQQMDMDFESSPSTSIDSYTKMITLKTSALIAGALKIGAQVANAPAADCDKLYDIGINLGVAFQLQDDLLDTYGDQNLFGKRIGGDILEKKRTFLLINALKISNPSQKEELLATINSTTLEDSVKIERVKSIYNALNIRDITEQAIDKYFTHAMDIISTIELDENKLSLINELAQTLVIRDK
ncbi:MAG: polyprenyl synthetase family protein [Rikenellaceae bacterium]